MAILLYDTLTKRKRELVTRDPGKVAMYVCGPTVYNHIHIGNARTFLSFDVIRRYLVYRGYDVRFVQNITDIDDKIIDRAAEEGIPASEVAAKYTEAFQLGMADLGIEPPTVAPKATEEIPAMIDMVERLIESGHAYVVDGDVYFPVRSFVEYGKLSGRDVDELLSGARVEVDERKRDPLDFALWKSAKPGEPQWESPWGPGRPGWHLECSVMAEKYLGPSFDIHGGGSDLVFPHHENEVAQSEAAAGQPFARYWQHGGMVRVDAEKMSKSAGNFMLLNDVLAAYPAPVIRLMTLQTHFRSPLDFSSERMEEAATAYGRLADGVRNLRWAAEAATMEGPAHEGAAMVSGALEAVRAKFEAEMDDDFNTAGALGAVFELARAANAFLAEIRDEPTVSDGDVLSAAAGEIVELIGVLGVTVTAEPSVQLPQKVVGIAAELAGYEGEDPDAAVRSLLEARSRAREAKDWGRADSVRDRLGGVGLLIEDTPQGPRVKPRE